MTEAQKAFEMVKDVLDMIITVRHGTPKLILLSGINGATVKVTVELAGGDKIFEPRILKLSEDNWYSDKNQN